jgi:exonuclease VII large subunit
VRGAARGGGSLEELMPFNAEAARAGQAVRLVFGGRKEAQAVIQGRQGRLL